MQICSGGLAAALWNLANVRAVMSIAPVMGRAHFLALYSVASNLTIGVVPLLWGPLMDLLERWQVSWGWWHWNAYSLLYCAFTLTMLLSLLFLRAMKETDKMSWDVFMHELLVQTPSRAVREFLAASVVPPFNETDAGLVLRLRYPRRWRQPAHARGGSRRHS